MLLYKYKVMVHFPADDSNFFDIVMGVLLSDTFASFLFIICQDYILRTSIDPIKENGFK